jgi:hypothetical protein
MKNKNIILLSACLVAVTVACKWAFGSNISFSGFSPVIAIALFSGFVSREKNMSFLLPLLSLLISDAIIHFLYTQDLFAYAGFYSGQWKNYLILLGCTFIGWMMQGKSYSGLLGGAIAAPTMFFLISNFMVWLSASEAFYSKDVAGLMKCYTAGLPFYRNSLIATLVFLPLILVAYNLLTRKKNAVVLA